MPSYNNPKSLSFSTTLALLLIICFNPKPCISSRTLPHDPTKNYTHFIITSCITTMYPSLCITSLSSYASTIRTSHARLALTSLSIALNATKSASSAINKISKSADMSPRMAAAIRDCMELVRDSVGQLKQSMQAMVQLGTSSDFAFQLNSIQTWASAAITNDFTCTDGLDGEAMDGRVRNVVMRKVTTAEELTSNALAFVNRLAAIHS